MPRDPRFPKGVYKTRRPKMTDHRGRTWGAVDVFLLDGTKVTGYIDFTWGFYVYFQNEEGVWYSFEHSNFHWPNDYTLDLRRPY